MVTIYDIKKNTLESTPKLMVELRGLSTDTKPKILETGEVANGSVFIEIDTQDVYLYDGENESWLPEEDAQENNDNSIGENNLQKDEVILEPIIEKEEEPIIENVDESR